MLIYGFFIFACLQINSKNLKPTGDRSFGNILVLLIMVKNFSKKSALRKL
jgi:hypothetical protein